MERSNIYRELRRWVDAPCEIQSNVAAIESALKRLKGRFETTEEFDPSDALGEVMYWVEQLFVAHIKIGRRSKWSNCDVVAADVIKWRDHEWPTEEIETELIKQFTEHAIPFDCFSILPYEERCQSMRGFLAMFWIHHDHLLASAHHLRIHRELRKKRQDDIKLDYCCEFVDELTNDLENVMDCFTRTVDEIATRIEYCLRSRLREVKSAQKKSTFLNLSVGVHKRTVINTLTGKSLNLMGQPALWSMFFAVYSAGSKGLLASQVEQACHGEWSNHRATKSKLNKLLQPLGVRIAPGEWCLMNI